MLTALRWRWSEIQPCMCYLQDISTDPARYNVVDYSEGANERDTK